jgi:tetratricopeptide (TPR) repeat protein
MDGDKPPPASEVDAAADRAQSLYREGLKRHRAKDYPGAIRSLEQAVALDPAAADAWEALGVLHDKQGQVESAIAATQRLVALRPDEIMAHTNLSRFYMKQGLKELAEAEQAKARLLGWKQELATGAGHGDPDLAQVPTGADAEAAPQIVTMIAGAASSAPAAPLDRDAPPPPITRDPLGLARKIQQFEALVAHNPDDVLSRFTLGRAYLEAGRQDDAIAMLEGLLERKPGHSAAYLPLGLAYEKAGKLARALRTFTRGIEVAQSNGDLHPRNQMQEQLARLQAPRAG